MLPSGHYVIGPSSATLHVRTAREGAAARVGHDLVIEVTRWEAALDVAGDDITLSLTADSTSLEPRWGLNGLNSLTDHNRDDIRKTIATKILKGAPISFRSTRVHEADGGLRVRGDLTIGPVTRELTFVLRMSSSSRIDVTAQLMQSNWDIKPFSAMLGTLKVRDTLEVVCKVQLPESASASVPKPAPTVAPAPAAVFAHASAGQPRFRYLRP
jgi:polyisoprenoid-binding protein YceI